MIRRLLLGCALLLTLALEGCYASGQSNIMVTSTPAGGRIYIDDEDTGLTTPAKIDLETFLNIGEFVGGDLVVTVRKNGFDPEQRVVHHHADFYTSRWVDGATPFWFVTAPVFWTFGDLFSPVAARWAWVPHEVHVVLYPTGEAPGIRN